MASTMAQARSWEREDGEPCEEAHQITTNEKCARTPANISNGMLEIAPRLNELWVLSARGGTAPCFEHRHFPEALLRPSRYADRQIITHAHRHPSRKSSRWNKIISNGASYMGCSEAPQLIFASTLQNVLSDEDDAYELQYDCGEGPRPSRMPPR